MRRGLLFFILFNVATVSYLVYCFWTLLMLLLMDGAADAISRAEIPSTNSDPFVGKKQLIPKIIHQTYANTSLPKQWISAQASCKAHNKDYEYKLWTDKSAREFIASEYPWFLETFDGYSFPIQRADAIRYFVLAYYGGIYIDLDDGCNRSLDPLLTYPAWVRRTLPTGISNDVMGSVPHHPFFLKVIDALPRYDRSWGLPYITVMGSTGPLFLSVIWTHYTRGAVEEQDRVRILFPDEYSKHPWSFFQYHVGNSWHRSDVKLILWMGKHWMSLTALGFLTAGVVFSCLWWAYGRLLLSGSPKGQQLRRRLPFWRRYSSKKNDDEISAYELLRQYNEDRLEA